MCFAVHVKYNDKSACHQPITTELCHSHIISIENRMNASTFRDILYMGKSDVFFKFSKLHKPQEKHERSYDFFIFNILNKILKRKNQENATITLRPSRCYGHATL